MGSLMHGPGIRIRAGVVALLTVAATGCGDYGGHACTASVDPSIILEIRDSVSGVGLADQALTTVTDGGFTDTLEYFASGDPGWQSGPSERAGTYDIAVTVAGYQVWTRDNVVVEEGVCHVRTQRILARLTP
jgi:hypothetical protein